DWDSTFSNCRSKLRESAGSKMFLVVGANPGADATKRYSPTETRLIENCPFASVLLSVTVDPLGSTSLTVAPATTLPCGSLTRPVIAVWAMANAQAKIVNTRSRHTNPPQRDAKVMLSP